MPKTDLQFLYNKTLIGASILLGIMRGTRSTNRPGLCWNHTCCGKKERWAGKSCSPYKISSCHKHAFSYVASSAETSRGYSSVTFLNRSFKRIRSRCVFTSKWMQLIIFASTLFKTIYKNVKTTDLKGDMP